MYLTSLPQQCLCSPQCLQHVINIHRFYNTTFSHACAHHNVHLGLEQHAKDVVREDDRHLADLQPAPPLHRSPRPHIHGQSQVTLSNQNKRKLELPKRYTFLETMHWWDYSLWNANDLKICRDEEDREINHHGHQDDHIGQPIEVKGQDAEGKVSRKKIAVLLDFVQIRRGEGPAQIFGTIS